MGDLSVVLTLCGLFIFLLVDDYQNNKEHKILEKRILEIENKSALDYKVTDPKQIEKVLEIVKENSGSSFNHKVTDPKRIEKLLEIVKNDKIPSELIVTNVLDKNVNGPSKLISRRRNHGIRSYRHNRLGRKSSFPLICLMAMLSLAKN